MSRNDGILYTGMSSAVDRKVAAERKEHKQEAETLAEKVSPIVEPVLALIATMKDDVTNVKHVVFSDKPEADKLKAVELMKHDYELLTKVESNLKRLFRTRGDK